MPKTRLVYSYNEEGIYIGNSIAYEDQLEKDQFLLPARSTFKAPNPKPGYLSKWDGNKWQDVLPEIPTLPIEELRNLKLQELENYQISSEVQKFKINHNQKDYQLDNNNETRNLLARKILCANPNQEISINIADETLLFSSKNLINLLSSLEQNQERQIANKKQHYKNILLLKDQAALENYNFKTGW